MNEVSMDATITWRNIEYPDFTLSNRNIEGFMRINQENSLLVSLLNYAPSEEIISINWDIQPEIEAEFLSYAPDDAIISI